MRSTWEPIDCRPGGQVPSGDRDPGILRAPYFQAMQRDFNPGGIFSVSNEDIGYTEGIPVHGSGDRHAVLTVSIPSWSGCVDRIPPLRISIIRFTVLQKAAGGKGRALPASPSVQFRHGHDLDPLGFQPFAQAFSISTTSGVSPMHHDRGGRHFNVDSVDGPYFFLLDHPGHPRDHLAGSWITDPAACGWPDFRPGVGTVAEDLPDTRTPFFWPLR